MMLSECYFHTSEEEEAVLCDDMSTSDTGEMFSLCLRKP